MEKKENIFSKILNFIKRIGRKDEQKLIPEKTSTTDNQKQKSDFLNALRVQNEESPEILDLQSKYEKDEISFGEMSDEQVHRLRLLYEKQVYELKKRIEKTQVV